MTSNRIVTEAIIGALIGAGIVYFAFYTHEVYRSAVWGTPQPAHYVRPALVLGGVFGVVMGFIEFLIIRHEAAYRR